MAAAHSFNTPAAREARTCVDCGAPFSAHKAVKTQLRCAECKRKYKIEYLREYHKKRTGDMGDGGSNVWRLTYDPRGALRDEWGNPEPSFTLEEIYRCCGKPGSQKYYSIPYRRNAEYPFAVGCKFLNPATGREARVTVAGRYLQFEVLS